MAQDVDLVGQHFIVDFPGEEITPDIRRLIRDGRIGGVILFGKNIRSAPQVRTLTTALQQVAAAAGLPPLFVTIDQEGGIVNRLVDGFTVFPSAMAIGASGREADAATAGRITAQELAAVGVNTNHAPVLDVNTDPDNPIIGVRAFGDDPAQVARLGIAYLTAAQAAGVLTTVKHFPGHGATKVDSHLDLPVVTKDPDRLQREELLPFKEALRAGADGVMVAHIVYPSLDPALPATLSRRLLTGLLREELGFEGVVFSDSMEMKAVADRWSRGDAAVAALRAGNDVVLACGRLEGQWESIEAARRAVEDGTLDPQALHASTARIVRIKAHYASYFPPGGDVGTEAAGRQAQEIADRAVTMVRRRTGRIPLPAGPTAVLHVGSAAWVRSQNTLGRELAQMLQGVIVAASLEQVLSGSWETVVAVSLSLRADEGVHGVQALQERFGDRLVVVGAGNPYELVRFPEVGTYLAAYGPDPASMRAAAKVLAGRLNPTGHLPVALPGLHPRGHAA